MPVKEAPVIGKIGGGMFILILIILWVAAHGGSNHMMYLALIFVFIVIALFTYGFWSAVSKGEGIWQYMGKQNLQHQQISNPDYHFGSMRNYKSHPQKNVHLCAPPKMGGARLQIYTIPLSQSPTSPSPLRRLPSSPPHHNAVAALQRNPSVSSTNRYVDRAVSSNQSRRTRGRSSFRRKPQESTEEQIKVEVYSENSRKSSDRDLREIKIPIPPANEIAPK